MSQLVRLEGKYTVQRAHCVVSSCVLLVFSRVIIFAKVSAIHTFTNRQKIEQYVTVFT